MPEQINYESQSQRWLKYGANVVIASIVVILLAGVVVYLAQRANRRLDTTESHVYSLKPQTLNILKDDKQKIQLISLYRQQIPDPKTAGKLIHSPYVDAVDDLLDEYRRNSSNIDAQSIDPVQNNNKVESLIAEVSGRYGGEIQKYKKVTDAYAATYGQIKQIASDLDQKAANLSVDQLAGGDDESQNVDAAIKEPRDIVKVLNSSSDTIKRALTDKPPNYKGATDEIQDKTDIISQVAAKVNEIFAAAKDNAKLPAPIRAYASAAIPGYQHIKQLADDLNKETKNLGELKLDDLRQSLKAKDVILVVGAKDMRVLPFDQVWKTDDRDLQQLAPGQELKPRFAGEQEISTAILALEQAKKTKVVFIRNGGPPMTTPGQFPFQAGGPMSVVADQLRQYNFDVMEKDISGMWAMQAQMQQQPVEPEPSDADIKDAIWVVLNFPTQQQQPGMPQPTMAPKVSDHLTSGGSAIILSTLRSENLGDILKPWGIEMHPEALVVHQMIKPAEGRQGDALDEAQRLPFVFDIRNYGDSPIVKPVNSLASLLVPMIPVKTMPAPGVKTTPIIPIPENPPSWGETDIESVGNGQDVKFDPTHDIAQPIYGGAVAEKDKGGRLIVFGTPAIALDRYINEPDPKLLRSGWVVSRFPANEQLFVNSIFWLAKMDSMIAISPSAMEVSRLPNMSMSALNAWRVGGLLIGLPGLIVVIGVLVWIARRD